MNVKSYKFMRISSFFFPDQNVTHGSTGVQHGQGGPPPHQLSHEVLDVVNGDFTLKKR